LIGIYKIITKNSCGKNLSKKTKRDGIRKEKETFSTFIVIKNEREGEDSEKIIFILEEILLSSEIFKISNKKLLKTRGF